MKKAVLLHSKQAQTGGTSVALGTFDRIDRSHATPHPGGWLGLVAGLDGSGKSRHPWGLNRRPSSP
jgi:hypothetical protein